VAREEGIYLTFPLITIRTDPAERPAPDLLVENKSVMITPQGEVAYEYIKANLLIGWEMEHAVPGERVIKSIDTPYGTLASVICLDMDFPNFMRQAGQQGVDIVLSGAIDGTPSTQGNPMHSVMASYRAIESGFSLARGGASAQNLLVDYLGRVRGRSDYYAVENRTAVAHLPVAGTRTVYTAVGDVFPWLCIIGLAAMLVYVVTTRNT
jgi:apolipoprotein N-acyltransferase